MSFRPVDGGPAFPMHPGVMTLGTDNHGDDRVAYCSGMSLRDWFAGQALIGLILSDPGDTIMRWDNVAFGAYAMADAMLAEGTKERSK